MFGGFGYYKNGKFFGFVADGKLYFKVGNTNKKDYEERGSKPFVYRGHKGREIEMTYWELPADIMEDRESLEAWIDKAIEAKKQ
jgi:DNA transformation protein